MRVLGYLNPQLSTGLPAFYPTHPLNVQCRHAEILLHLPAQEAGAVLGLNPLLPPPEKGGGNFVFLLEDNINDAPDGLIDPITGDASGHNLVAPGHGLQADPRYGDFMDPATFLDMYTSDSGQNRTGWANAEYDRLIAAAAREADNARRFELFSQAERILCEQELPIIPLFFERGNYLLKPRIEGLYENVRDILPIHRARLRTARAEVRP